MKTPSTKAQQGHEEPLHPLEAMARRIDDKLRASGCTVEVVEPSDSNEYVVTFPQGRRVKPDRKPRRGP